MLFSSNEKQPLLYAALQNQGNEERSKKGTPSIGKVFSFTTNTKKNKQFKAD